MRYQVWDGALAGEFDNLEEAIEFTDKQGEDALVYDTRKEQIAYKNWETSEVF